MKTDFHDSINVEGPEILLQTHFVDRKWQFQNSTTVEGHEVKLKENFIEIKGGFSRFNEGQDEILYVAQFPFKEREIFNILLMKEHGILLQ